MLTMQIESGLKERAGKAVSNFGKALPSPDSDLVTQVFKDPYLFDFLGTDIPRRELEIERKLTEHIQEFLLELGRGFAFVGRQVELEVGGETFRIDMLFYHLKLRCYVVIELKAGRFEPGYVAQLNLYRNVVDDVLRHETDGKTIGLLLVREKNDTVVRYSLEGFEESSRRSGVAGGTGGTGRCAARWSRGQPAHHRRDRMRDRRLVSHRRGGVVASRKR